MHFFVNVRSSSIHGIRFGSGNQLLICFHGFGEDAEKFRALHSGLSDRYTLISIDLPFHGNTKWQQDELFLQEDLKFLINRILEREQCKRFSLMGYSLGGKLVLSAILNFASQLDSIILIAPDGVKANAWYNIAVYPEWGRRLFLRFVQKPQFVFHIARILRFIGVLSQRFYKFLQMQTNTQAKRRKVYDSWLTLKDFAVKLEHAKSLLNQYRVKSYVFVGKYDMLITPATGAKFADGLLDCELIVLEKGHNLVTEALNEPLKIALQK